MKQTRYATLKNAPSVHSDRHRGVQFQPTLIAVTYELRGGHWFPLRFQPARVTGGSSAEPLRRNLRPPAPSDWYAPIVAALTPEPGIPEFDLTKES